MSDQDLIAQFLATREPVRVPAGRKNYSRRAIKALAEGADYRFDEFRSDQKAGRFDLYGRRLKAIHVVDASGRKAVRS